MSTMTKMAAANGIAAAISRIIGFLLSIVLTPIILGGVGRQLYGVLTITGSLYDYLALFRGGLGTAMRRHVTVNVHRNEGQTATHFYEAGFWWGTILRIPILAAALLLSGPLCDFVRVPPELRSEAVVGVRLILLAAWIGDFAAMFEVPIFASGKTASINYLRSGTGILRLAIMATAFSLFVPTLQLYGYLLIVVTLTLTVSMAWLADRARTVGRAIPSLAVGTAAMRKELFSYGGLALVGQIGELLWVASDNILIGRLFGAGDVTLYSFGARWLPLLRSSGISILRSIQPLFTKLEAEKTEARSRRATRSAVAIAAGFSVPVCLMPCVLGDIFLTQWVGAEYTSAYPVILITLIPLSLDLTLYPIWVVLSARGRIGWISVGEVALAITKIVLGLVLAIGFDKGILGFAWANGIALLVRNLLIRPFAVRDVEALPPLVSLLRVYLNAVLGAAPGLGLLWMTRSVYSGSLTAVVTAGVIGGALSLGGSLWASMGRSGLEMLRKGLTAKDRDNDAPSDDLPSGGERP